LFIAVAPDARAYILPSTNKINRITRIKPTPPLGPYPQLLLCGHAGTAPTNANARIINRINPILMSFSFDDL